MIVVAVLAVLLTASAIGNLTALKKLSALMEK